MTNELVVINSLKVPKIKKILLYEMKFLVPNYSCLQNPWLAGYRPPDPRSLCPLLNLLNPPRTKFLGTPLPSSPLNKHLTLPPSAVPWSSILSRTLLQFFATMWFVCAWEGPRRTVQERQTKPSNSEGGCVQRGRNLPQDIPVLTSSITTGYGSFGTPAPFVTAISWRHDVTVLAPPWSAVALVPVDATLWRGRKAGWLALAHTV